MVDSAGKSSDRPILLVGVGRGGIRIADVVRGTCSWAIVLRKFAWAWEGRS